jgi:hypothetical protein
MKIRIVMLMLAISAIAGMPSAKAALINGAFETGNLAGWTIFTTPNGYVGDAPLPAVSAFDVDGDSVASNSLTLSVGYAVAPCSFPGSGCPRPTEGGGVQQSLTLQPGHYSFFADIATRNQATLGFNQDAGTFSLLLDGVVLDTISLGEINSGSTLRNNLGFEGYLAGGVYDFRVLVTRQFAQADTLFQYVDNVRVISVPEPASAILLLAAFCSLLATSGFGRRLARLPSRATTKR